MKAIIAVNNLNYIGFENGLPWDNKEDLQHFKKLTSQSDINEVPKLLVGYNTLKTLPPLKGRELVLESGPFFNIEDIDWCIGGRKTYEKYCQYFTELHISHINDFTFGDVTYPELKRLNPNCKIFNYFY